MISVGRIYEGLTITGIAKVGLGIAAIGSLINHLKGNDVKESNQFFDEWKKKYQDVKIEDAINSVVKKGGTIVEDLKNTEGVKSWIDKMLTNEQYQKLTTRAKDFVDQLKN